jgi:capsular polysaccharide biosynthesis protein
MTTGIRNRYRNFSPKGVKIHPLKRGIARLKLLFPRAYHFFFFGLPPPETDKVSRTSDPDHEFVSVERGIACELGANLNPDGTYIPELTLGAGIFIETRFLQKQRCFPKIKSLPGKVVSLVGEGQVNYYRWLMETLPRMRFVHSKRFAYEWIYCCQAQPFHRESIRLLGCDSSRIVSSNQCRYLQAQDLIVPKLVNESEPWIIPWLRQQFLPEARNTQPKALPKRIYITRRKADSRRVTNEAELLEKLRLRDFVVIVLEDCGWLNQVALFQNAEIIIAPHGAGLANLVFASVSALVIELIAEAYPFTFFPEISRQLGIEHHLLFCAPATPLHIQASDLQVRVESVLGLLDKRLLE